MIIPELCFWRLLESRKHWPTSPCNEDDWIAPVREIQISPCFQHDFHDVKLVASNMDPLFFFHKHSSTNLFFFGFKSSIPISPRLVLAMLFFFKVIFPKPHPWPTKEDTGSKQCPTCHAIAGGPGITVKRGYLCGELRNK